MFRFGFSKTFIFFLGLIFIFIFLFFPQKVIAASYSYDWTKTFESSGYDYGSSISVNYEGSIFFTGNFSSTTDFDPGVGVDNHSVIGGSDIFLTKYNSDDSYGWTKTVGGTGYEVARSITTDSNGNIYMAGLFEGTIDFNPTGVVENHTSAGLYDIFVTKYDSNGTYYWTKTLGSTGSDNASCITVDNLGNIYFCGNFEGTVDFDYTGSVDNHTSNGSYDLFLTRYNSDGTYGWTVTIGGSGVDTSYGVFNDTDNNIYLTGTYESTVDFNPTLSIENHISNGAYDGFISKYSNSGSYNWTKTIGGLNNDYINSVTQDYLGNLYITGSFISTVDFNPNAGIDNFTSNGSSDIYFSKYTTDGSYIWTKTFGGTGADDRGYSMTTDSKNNILLVGTFSSTVDFDPGIAIVNRSTSSYYDLDAYIAVFNSEGTFKWVHTFSSTEGSGFYGVGVNSNDQIYLIGDFGVTTDFDPLGSNYSKTTDASWSGAVTKVSNDTLPPTITLSTSSEYVLNANQTIPEIKGTVSDSIGEVVSVEYQPDSVLGSWISCNADDGSFNSLSELFTCNVTETYTSGSHTIYLRSTDSNGNVTLNGYTVVIVSIVSATTNSSSTSSIVNSSKTSSSAIKYSSSQSSIETTESSSTSSSITEDNNESGKDILTFLLTLKDNEGNPYSNVLIKIRMGNKVVREIYTNEKGELGLLGLVLGEYVIEFEKDGVIYTKNITLTKNDFANESNVASKTIVFSVKEEMQSTNYLPIILFVIFIFIFLGLILIIVKRKKY